MARLPDCDEQGDRISLVRIPTALPVPNDEERRMIVWPEVVSTVVDVDGVAMSALVAEPDQEPKAVILALHGGATSARYFDCPGHRALSLLHTGAAAGFTVVALDRPGYGSSAGDPDAMNRPHQRAALAYGALDRILAQRPRGAGVFIMGHSNGCELAMWMATETRGAELLGIELAGTGWHYQPEAREILTTATGEHRWVSLYDLLWHPQRLYPPEVLNAAIISSSAPAYEEQMMADWTRRTFVELVPAVRVPVHFSIAQHEKVWQRDSSALDEIAVLFSGAPRFILHEQPEAGHNISLGHTAGDYHTTVLSFVQQCLAERLANAQQDVDLAAE
ncbi:thioesterase [Mycobacterium pseudoshottsii JCM 15466]|nr:thioesterase [Mycobacterium pseudoshottsii JCM 15466]